MDSDSVTVGDSDTVGVREMVGVGDGEQLWRSFTEQSLPCSVASDPLQKAMAMHHCPRLKFPGRPARTASWL
jgi:hypothetical protein